MYAPLLPGDTTRLFCERHGLTDQQFFALNPEKSAYLDDDGVTLTGYHDPGELARVNHEVDASGQELVVLGDAEQQAFGGQGIARTHVTTAAAATAGAGLYFLWGVVGIALTVGFWWIVWRGVKSVAKDA